MIPLGSHIRTRLATKFASRDSLLACLDHSLEQDGNARLMTLALRNTLCDHAGGNYRILTTMAAELPGAGAQRDLAVLDEKLYLDVFAPPAMTTPAYIGDSVMTYRHPHPCPMCEGDKTRTLPDESVVKIYDFLEAISANSPSRY